MTAKAARGTINLSIPLPKEEYLAFVQEAKGAPYNGRASELARKIIRGRHEMVIEVSDDLEKAQLAHDLALDALEKENEKLLKALSSSKADSGLSGIVMKKDQQDQTLTAALAQHKREWQQEQQEKEYATLKEEHKDLKLKYEQNEEKLAELKEATSVRQTIGEYMSMVGDAGGAILNHVPALKERLEQDGLSGLWGGPKTTLGIGAGLTESQQEDMGMGMAIRKDYPGDNRDRLIDLLRYFKANPQVFLSLIKQDAFQKFVNRPRTPPISQPTP